MSRWRTRRRCPPDHVERYLRRLAIWAPRRCRHDLIMEARRHLYDATRQAEQNGLSHELAQRTALRAFGPAWRIGLSARGVFDSPLWGAATRLLTVPGAGLYRLRRPRGRGKHRAMHRRARPRLY